MLNKDKFLKALPILIGLLALGGIPLSVALAESPDHSAALMVEKCLAPGVPADADLVMVAVGSGSHVQELTLSDGMTRLGTVELRGRPDGGPVVLLAFATEPVQWQVHESVRDRVKGVLLYGQQTSIVNLKDGTPVAEAKPYDPAAEAPCGDRWVIATEGGLGVEKNYLLAESVFGKPLSNFVGRNKTNQINIDHKHSTRDFVQGDIKVVKPATSEIIDPSSFPSVSDWKKAMIEKGHIRFAERGEGRIWERVVSARLKSGKIAPVSFQYTDSAVFVAQTKIKIPERVGVGFLIPRNVPRPIVKKRGTVLLLFEKDGSCEGFLCNSFNRP
jgi:hypothetical protein